jgi:hypothetical protein
MEMNDSDKREFSVILTSALSQYGKKFEEDALRETLRMWWRLMQSFDIETFRAAMEAHMLDPDAGRFAPMPAHIAGQIQKLSPRVKAQIGVDEAWSIAMQAEDEYSTVVWTQPIAEAWGIAKNVLPDRTGARMAFKSAYERILSGLPANAELKWYPSIGQDSARREDALNDAVKMGRLSGEHAAGLLPPPKNEQNKEIAAQYLSQLRLMIGKK